MAQARRLSHPLCGADLGTLLKVSARSGPVEPRSLPQLSMAFLAAAGRLPASLAERAYVAAKRTSVEPIKPPIFILGHWRSGTTHLYNVLSKSPRFGYVSPFATALPWDFLLMGRALKPMLEKALPEHRYIDKVTVESTSPQEDEIALANMTHLSFYHGLYFPNKFREFFDAGVFFDGVSTKEEARWSKTLEYLYLKLAIEQPGTQLLIKNPVYTARVDILRKIWPDAKFIHIHRNPYKVFVSMQNFYSALFREFALQPYDAVPVDDIILDCYERMMAKMQADCANLGPEQFIELRFDDFQADALGESQRIYDQLGIDGFSQDRAHFEAYLASVKNYEKNKFGFPDDVRRKVGARWAKYIDQWHYTAPA